MTGRLAVVVAVGGLWVAAIAGRLYQLQVVRYDHYVAKAERQQQRVVETDPPRGTIYDARGRELAVSVEVDSAFAVPSEIDDPRAAARELAGVLKIDAAKLERQLASDRDFVWVKRKLDPPLAAAVRRLDLDGIHFLEESKRYYPMRELAAQVLGYVGTDNNGLAGLELVYDEAVRGKPGRRTVLRDARRGTVVSPDLSFADPEPGRDLHLTIDATIQHIVERELEKAVEERGAKKGTAVLVDPATGGVLAMATYPGFDANDFASYPASQTRNRAIVDVYEPGSTFKVITAASALDSGLMAPDDELDCEMGGITLSGIRIRDHKPFGRLSFAQVLAKSSNVGVIKTALLIGEERLQGTIDGFGFGRLTGIDLRGESRGILEPFERWRPLTKAYVSFGQGIAVTPIQLVAALAAIANEGTLIKPHLVAAMGRQGGEGIERLHPRPPVVGHPITPESARTLKLLLEGVVAEGTGRAAAVPGYRVAGKTGTAQKAVAGGYSRSGYVPSFVGFAPVERPVLAGIVAIDEPQGWAYHGGQVAAPVFGAIARQVLLYLDVRPERESPVPWPGEIVTASLPTTALPPEDPLEPLELAPSEAIGPASGDPGDPAQGPVPDPPDPTPAATAAEAAHPAR